MTLLSLEGFEADAKPARDLKELKRRVDVHVGKSRQPLAPEILAIQTELAARVPNEILLGAEYGIDHLLVRVYRERIRAQGIPIPRIRRAKPTRNMTIVEFSDWIESLKAQVY